MTISITSPTSTTSKIQQNGNDVLTVDSSNNVTVTNNLSVSGTVTANGDINFDSGTLHVDAANNRVGIGTSSPTYKLQVQEGVYTLLAGADNVGSSLTDATQKTMRYGVPHYTNAEEPVNILYASSSSGNNVLSIGGGTSILNALTRISFYTAADATTLTGTERMRIDSSGNVGIGTSSPTYALSIGDANGMYSDGDGLHIVQNTSQLDTLALKSQGTITYNTNYDDGTTNAHHIFKVSSTTEAMRIDSDGNVGIGTTNTTDVTFRVFGSDTTSATIHLRVGNGNGDLFYVRGDGRIVTGTQAGSPYNLTTGSAANMHVSSAGILFRSTSSIKYKTDVQDATHGLDDVMKLRAVTYKGKSDNDGDTVFGGLIAEEVHDAGLTEFVQYDDNGNPDALAYGHMVSLAFKAIQELKAENDTLKSQLSDLETRIQALENPS